MQEESEVPIATEKGTGSKRAPRRGSSGVEKSREWGTGSFEAATAHMMTDQQWRSYCNRSDHLLRQALNLKGGIAQIPVTNTYRALPSYPLTLTAYRTPSALRNETQRTPTAFCTISIRSGAFSANDGRGALLSAERSARARRGYST